MPALREGDRLADLTVCVCVYINVFFICMHILKYRHTHTHIKVLPVCCYLTAFPVLWSSDVLFLANWSMRPIEQTAVCFSKHRNRNRSELLDAGEYNPKVVRGGEGTCLTAVLRPWRRGLLWPSGLWGLCGFCSGIKDHFWKITAHSR